MAASDARLHASGLRRDHYRIFSEGRIGGLRLKNRLIKAATAEGASEAGQLTDAGLTMYRAVARGGAGLIITGGMTIVPSGMAGGRLMWIFEDRFTESANRVVRAIRQAEPSCRVVAQICHMGVHGDEAVGPSARTWPWSTRNPRALTIGEVKETIAAHAQAARRVCLAGFDGVEIHAAHGYLLSAFLSPYTNTRTDKYGDGLQGRVAIVHEIIGALRVLVEPDFPVLVKINCDDHVNGGIDTTTFPALAREIQRAGAQAIEVSANTPTGQMNVAASGQRAYYLKHLETLNLGIPIILTGGNRSVDELEAVVESGASDFFGLGRPLLREPELPERWLAGRGGPKSTCISCNRCLRGLSKGQPTRCRVSEVDS